MAVIDAFPTDNDVSDSTSEGAGRRITEGTLSGMFSIMRAGYNFVESGLEVYLTSSTTIGINTGVAFISGFRVAYTGPGSLDVSANTNNYVYLQLVKDTDGLVSGFQFINQNIADNDAAWNLYDGSTYPVDAVLLGRTRVISGAITKVEIQKRGPPGFKVGRYRGTATSDGQYIVLEFAPVLVIVSGAADNTADGELFAMSSIAAGKNSIRTRSCSFYVSAGGMTFVSSASGGFTTPDGQGPVPTFTRTTAEGLEVTGDGFRVQTTASGVNLDELDQDYMYVAIP